MKHFYVQTGQRSAPHGDRKVEANTPTGGAILHAAPFDIETGTGRWSGIWCEPESWQAIGMWRDGAKIRSPIQPFQDYLGFTQRCPFNSIPPPRQLQRRPSRHTPFQSKRRIKS